MLMSIFFLAMLVIRMVKMFGWEGRMSERIDEKREIELQWVWWTKVYSLVTLSFQCVLFLCFCEVHSPLHSLIVLFPVLRYLPS